MIPVVLLLAASALMLDHVQAMTDKYRLTLQDDLSTTVVIGWNQVSGSNPVVYYGTTDQGTNWSAYPYNRGVDKQVIYAGMDNRFSRLTGLLPDIVYYFVIKDSEGTSSRYSFRTAPNDPSKRLSIIAGGDSRHGEPGTSETYQWPVVHDARRNANMMVKKLRPHVVLFNGDMILGPKSGEVNNNAEWQRWFEDWQLTKGDDGRLIPVVVAIGDHEQENIALVNLFDVPSAGVYYALPFGGNLLRIYSLNTEFPSEIEQSQTDWLKNDLIMNSNVIWKMAQYHRPIRPHSSRYSGHAYLYTNWAPLFYDYGVRVVNEAAAHVVKRTWPIRPYTGIGSDEGFIQDNDCGTVYLGEGGWGAPLRSANYTYDWTRDSDSFYQFEWIFVDQSRIETKTVKFDNVANVGQVNDNDIFTPPANLDIWNPSNGPVITIPRSAISRISSGNDDAEEAQSGSMYIDSTDIELVYETAFGNQTIGLIFRNLHIPQGATITNAYVQFTVDETSSSTCNLIIRGEDVDTPANFQDVLNNVSSRTKTSASVNWAPPAWNTIGEAGANQRHPTLKILFRS